jgi:hypothetical protein
MTERRVVCWVRADDGFAGPVYERTLLAQILGPTPVIGARILCGGAWYTVIPTPSQEDS